MILNFDRGYSFTLKDTIITELFEDYMDNGFKDIDYILYLVKKYIDTSHEIKFSIIRLLLNMVKNGDIELNCIVDIFEIFLGNERYINNFIDILFSVNNRYKILPNVRLVNIFEEILNRKLISSRNLVKTIIYGNHDGGNLIDNIPLIIIIYNLINNHGIMKSELPSFNISRHCAMINHLTNMYNKNNEYNFTRIHRGNDEDIASYISISDSIMNELYIEYLENIHPDDLVEITKIISDEKYILYPCNN